MRSKLFPVLVESCQILRYMMDQGGVPSAVQDAIVTPEAIGTLIGTFELNNVDVVVPSPLKSIMQRLGELEKVMSRCAVLWRDVT
jgi:hypothetical protein